MVSAAVHLKSPRSSARRSFVSCHALKINLPQATGWFLTHGGHGGIMESLSSGVPL